MSAEEINKNQLEGAIRKFITIETAQQISRREVRRQLEQEFNLEEDTLSSRKKEINEILQNVLTDLLQEENKKKNEELKKNKKVQEHQMKKEEEEEEEEKETPEEQKRTPTNNENNIKKVKEQNSNEQNESNDDGDEKDTSDSSNERSSKKRKNTSLQHSTSAKKRQYNIMTKEDFLKNAKTLICKISENISLNLQPRVFRTGSCGWHMMDKVYLLVGDQNVLCQFCINCSVIGSKQWE